MTTCLNTIDVRLTNIEERIKSIEHKAMNVTERDLDLLHDSIKSVKEFIKQKFKTETDVSIDQASTMILEYSIIDERLFEIYIEFIGYLQRLNKLACKIPFVV